MAESVTTALPHRRARRERAAAQPPGVTLLQTAITPTKELKLARTRLTLHVTGLNAQASYARLGDLTLVNALWDGH
eukprot:6196679-Pleurochrysis_carterae.AAC.1